MRTTYKSEPQGLGGWLILPALGLLLTPITMVLQLRNEVLPELTPEAWVALTSPGSPAYNPRLVLLVGVELITNACLLLFVFWVIWKFFTKSRQLPKLYIIWVVVGLAVQAVDLGLAMSIPVIASQLTFPGAYKDLARSIVQCLIWIPYFLSSRRVSNTFVN